MPPATNVDKYSIAKFISCSLQQKISIRRQYFRGIRMPKTKCLDDVTSERNQNILWYSKYSAPRREIWFEKVKVFWASMAFAAKPQLSTYTFWLTVPHLHTLSLFFTCLTQLTSLLLHQPTSWVIDFLILAWTIKRLLYRYEYLEKFTLEEKCYLDTLPTIQSIQRCSALLLDQHI